MTENTQKTRSTFFRDLALVVASSWLAAYLSISVYGERLEQTKTELAIEQKILENQMRVVEVVIEKASTLHQLAPLHRQYDLITKFYPKELAEMAKTIDTHQVSKEDIINAQKEFQIALFSSKPFIPENVFEKLAVFGAKINQFIVMPNDDVEALHKAYTSAGNEYAQALKLIRRMYQTSVVSRDS